MAENMSFKDKLDEAVGGAVDKAIKYLQNKKKPDVSDKGALKAVKSRRDKIKAIEEDEKKYLKGVKME